MKTIIPTTLLILASTSIVLAGSVQAQSQTIRDRQTDDFTLSGDSLEGIETRTAEGDYRQFFGSNAGAIQINESYQMTKKGSHNPLQVGKDAELQINRQTPQPINAAPFRDNERLNDTGRVELKLDLAE
ncbi:hypothetical protein ACE1CI_10330 [Aerosakkonemataceae cyanobacterium BLCC-F50]|uniref:Uncharacterized protein n=1 Tax=Floridaenema flaviceps BLCC-F50 TaxID=3153642 RepID=A0ABV4XQA8_9CYAN